ncbi:conserved hypothetical protein (DUF1254) [Formosa agariphila KMM 3901]|uniref:DUF1254 domain-containing protein n=1 Tax=Formosa agariphila (strain DSM 15362 / KCTC 12365 / LMG 23005 / KMM 3901 / M-2Alg 35-1) TaxID=1347342 RepID=T2KKA5_FORAG|nr:DUF1254 domain-containing protein [Formosa agariphila]CDF78873.1 conserved hypothetical protein (DUF1254) [Formosa agariphila KMM 3901]
MNLKFKLPIALCFISLLISGCEKSKEGKKIEIKEDVTSSIQSIKAKFNTDVPEKILTPDVVDTRLGTLNFFDGLPSEETTKKMFDNLDFMRGVETFLNGIPATSIEGIRLGLEELGANESNKVVIFDDLMDSNPLFLTGNTSTVYATTFLNLKENGPTVVEVPAGCGPGTVNDAYFRFVVDMGAPGPDRGKGGKYLILPPDYDGEIPEGYFVSKSTSYVNWLILRGFLVNGKTDVSSKMYRDGLRIYPLKDKDNQPAMEFINASKKIFNTIHANNYDFYKELGEVIEREPVSFLDPELRGLFSSIGIQKGLPFNPDARMKNILEDAVKVGNATARAIAFKTRDSLASVFKTGHWESGFIGGDYKWLKDEGRGGRYLDARTRFFYFATVNTPAMVLKMVGKGSQYAICMLDSEGDYLDGNKNYSLNIPADAPAKEFWSLVMYDPQTRSELQTSQALPSVSSQRTPLVENEDGSVTLYFGATNNAPKGKEANWLQSVPGKGFFVIFRLYGPLDPWFNKTWQPGEFEELY